MCVCVWISLTLCWSLKHLDFRLTSFSSRSVTVRSGMLLLHPLLHLRSFLHLLHSSLSALTFPRSPSLRRYFHFTHAVLLETLSLSFSLFSFFLTPSVYLCFLSLPVFLFTRFPPFQPSTSLFLSFLPLEVHYSF